MTARTLFSGLVAAAALAALPTSASAAIVVAGAKPVSGTEGSSIGNQRIVTFDDAGACSPTAYTVTIAWGDGTTSDGSIAKSVQSSPGTCTYDAAGNHTYTTAGQYPVTATICRGAECATTPAAGTATIADAEIRGEGFPISAVSGQAFSGPVAELKDANRESRQTDFSATVDWGDGTAPSPGRVTGDRGGFIVDGTHTYAAPGAYRAVAIVTHGGRQVALDPSTVVVAAGTTQTAPSTGSGALPSPVLRVLGRVTLRSVRSSGVRISVGLGASTSRTLRVQLLDAGTGRTIWSGRVSAGRAGTGNLRTIRVRFTKKVRGGLRKGRIYVVRVPRQAGLPTLQAQFRVR